MARVMLSKSRHLSLAGSALPAWLRSTLQTAACASGTAAMGQVGTCDVPGALQSHFILPGSLDPEEDTEV